MYRLLWEHFIIMISGVPEDRSSLGVVLDGCSTEFRLIVVMQWRSSNIQVFVVHLIFLIANSVHPSFP